MPLFVDWARDVLEAILAAIPTSENPALIKGIKSKFRDDFPGNSLNPDNWEVLQLGNGQAITVANSELQIASGTIANSETIIRSKNKFSIPAKVNFLFYISQRIANQNFIVEIVDSTGDNYARWSFSGTNTTTSFPSVGNFGAVGNTNSFSTSNNNSSTYVLYEISLGLDEVNFCTRFPDVGNLMGASVSKNRKLPDPNLDYFVQIRVANTAAAASNTTIFFDSFSYHISELLSAEITKGRGSISASEGIPMIGAGGFIGISGFVGVSTLSTIVTLDNAAYFTETIAALLADSVFIGGSRDTSGRKSLTVLVVTDQPGVLFVDWSPDQIIWHNFPGYNCTAAENQVIRLETPLRFYRIRYVNGPANANPKIYTLQRFL